jgi:hypothetical protein
MKISFFILFVLLCFVSVHAQWTEPVPMAPQFGDGIRAPWISNDGLRLYLCSIADVFVTTRDSMNAPWGDLIALPPHINASPTQNSACESPTGDTLYFTSDSDQRPESGYGWFDVYYSVRTDTGWGPAINGGPNINGPGREWSVGISRDGSILLLSSGGPQGGYPHLYYSLKQVDNTWGIAIEIRPYVTLDEVEAPSLSPDNNRLFFSCRGANSGDIYESRLINGIWQPAVALPAPVNTVFGTEMSPCIANDGRTLWFRMCPWQGLFQIYTSTDTTVSALGPSRIPQTSSQKPILRVTTDSSEGLKLTVSGITIRGNQEVQVHDILGRLVASYNVQFVSDGQQSIGIMPALSVASGTYIVSMNTNNGVLSTKFTRIN